MNGRLKNSRLCDDGSNHRRQPEWRIRGAFRNHAVAFTATVPALVAQASMPVFFGTLPFSFRGRDLTGRRRGTVLNCSRSSSGVAYGAHGTPGC